MKKFLTAIVVVAMLLTLSIPAMAATNSIQYQELVTPPGDVDANGQVNALDLAECKLMLLGLEETNDLADANVDGKVNILDLIRIKNATLG